MTHGTRANYRKGCKCEHCMEANREYNRRWYSKNKTKYTQSMRNRYAEDPKYRQRRRDLANDWRKKNPEDSRAMWQERRALKAGSEVTPVDLADLWTGYCALCGGVMDYDLKYPDLLSKSLDHDIPLSLGGSHSKDNLQWTHLTCNLSKGARVA